MQMKDIIRQPLARAFGLLAILSLGFAALAQTSSDSAAKQDSLWPRLFPNHENEVQVIDLDGLKKLLQRDSKDTRPLLINFWATWCDPCREEFPDLVKLDAAYKGKIDFVTVSLDDLEDIKTTVPKFLSKMRATMPTYLLSTTDEDAAIAVISKDFQGNLPFTILLT